MQQRKYVVKIRCSLISVALQANRLNKFKQMYKRHYVNYNLYVFFMKNVLNYYAFIIVKNIKE